MSIIMTRSQQSSIAALSRRARLVWLALAVLPWFILSVASAEETAIAGPDVTIIAGEDRTIYEYRQGGELRMIKIVPSLGKPYYLVPRDGSTGFGNLERADMLLPSWVIFEF